MPRKAKKSNTLLEYDEEGNLIEVSDARLPGLIQPQQWDIEEEFNASISEALRQIQHEKMDQF
jgi:hypothetical protein